MVDDQITVVIPTSPIPSHPSTEIIERVIASIRFHLPTARLIIMADGVRGQVEHRRAAYKEYVIRLFEKAHHGEFGNAEVTSWTDPTQQAWMLRDTLKTITTPLVLFVEHDTYLVTTTNPRDIENTGRTDHPEDCIINWQDIADLIQSGGANMVRFYLWERIWHEHEYLMRGQMIQGETKFIKTVQYSQWPCIASADFYRRILTQYFQPTERLMIEPRMMSPVSDAPWEDFRVVIYHPEPNARRFYHLNGRADENGVRDPSDW